MSVVSEEDSLRALEALGMDHQGPLEDVVRDDLKKPGVILHLGVLISKALYGYGSGTFILDPDGKVVQVNPLHVYLDVGAIISPEDSTRPFRWVRPALGSGKPQYAAWRNGILWEVEFTDALQQESSPSVD
jgi:hypothetical protein